MKKLLVVTTLLLATVANAQVVTKVDSTSNYEKKYLTFFWDEYDYNGSESNQSVTHLELWRIKANWANVEVLVNYIPYTDTTATVERLANGLTEYYAMRAVSPTHGPSAWSNVIMYELPLKEKPEPLPPPSTVTGFRLFYY